MNRRMAAQKYWETHHYDIFTTQFFDPADESEARSRHESMLAQQPTRAYNRLPPSVKKSEGYSYDITTHIAKQHELSQGGQTEAKARNGTRQPLSETERIMKERGDRLHELVDNRALSRTSHQRYQESCGRGYDIINPALNAHKKSYNPPPPRWSRPEPALWSTLSSLK